MEVEFWLKRCNLLRSQISLAEDFSVYIFVLNGRDIFAVQMFGMSLNFSKLSVSILKKIF